MHEFFHGWRRKLGTVVLGIALVSSTAWTRSYLKPAQHSLGSVFVWSVNGTVTLGRIVSQREYVTPGFIQDSTWNWAGFTVGTYHQFYGRIEIISEQLIAPYWSITTPMTLLSAYLLLWKPRKRT